MKPTTNEIRERWLTLARIVDKTWNSELAITLSLLCDRVDELEALVAGEVDVIAHLRAELLEERQDFP